MLASQFNKSISTFRQLGHRNQEQSSCLSSISPSINITVECQFEEESQTSLTYRLVSSNLTSSLVKAWAITPFLFPSLLLSEACSLSSVCFGVTCVGCFLPLISVMSENCKHNTNSGLSINRKYKYLMKMKRIGWQKEKHLFIYLFFCVWLYNVSFEI